jgi:hypothetical protein
MHIMRTREGGDEEEGWRNRGMDIRSLTRNDKKPRKSVDLRRSIYSMVGIWGKQCLYWIIAYYISNPAIEQCPAEKRRVRGSEECVRVRKMEGKRGEREGERESERKRGGDNAQP